MRKATEPVQRRRLRDDIRLGLVDLIVTGKLKGGEKLNELALSRLLKASRTPLREALLHLEREGLVRSDQRRGFTVQPLSPREVRETYPLLAELECFAVRSTARLVPAVLPRLEKINAEFARAPSPKRALVLDAAWHNTLTSQSRNERLSAIIERLRRAIERYEHFYMADKSLISVSVKQHRGIIDAFKRGDLDGAIEAIRENYAFGMQILLNRMDEG
jgi:DNA-binding GntR family transcriptional regulator